jgi:hypothetical protein
MSTKTTIVVGWKNGVRAFLRPGHAIQPPTGFHNKAWGRRCAAHPRNVWGAPYSRRNRKSPLCSWQAIFPC